MSYVKNLVKAARSSYFKLSRLDSKKKSLILRKMARSLLANKAFILKENKKDLAAAVKAKQSKSFIDRLQLTDRRLKEMSLSLKEIADFADPLAQVMARWRRPNGLTIEKVRCPIGVVLVVYEARPNVTSDCAGLLFKSSNVGILRGGGASARSNLALARVLTQAARSGGLKFDPFFVVERSEHQIVDQLLKEKDYIDLVIPRGGEALIRKVVQSSQIPVIKHYKGVCHIFVDKSAKLHQAVKICVNAKVQRPSVCNAVETILVHQQAAGKFLPRLQEAFSRRNVQIRGCPVSRRWLKGVEAAKERDWFTEYLDLIVSVKVVASCEEAIRHINHYGSHHTESILTEDKAAADKFVQEVDSACCFVNISTRFSDGYQFGLGAEIGISTDKLHARGPMGVSDLTTYKYVVRGRGQIRE